MTENIEEKKSILPHFTESILQKLNEKLAAAQGEDSGEEKRFPGASVAESIFQKLSEKRAAALNEDNKVSLFVRSIDIETGETETILFNKNQK